MMGNQLRLKGAGNFEPTEWAAASRQGWSDNVAEPLLREKLDQNPEHSEWVAGTEALLSSNALIQCIANILSPIPWAPFSCVCGAGAWGFASRFTCLLRPHRSPARRAYPCLSSFTRLRGLKIRRACAHADTNCIARLEAGIEICLRQSKLPLRSIEIRLGRSKLHPALLGATKINNNLAI